MNPAEYSALTLAYLGDAYFELLAREKMLSKGNYSSAYLNKMSKKFVTAVSQSKAVDRMLPILTETETEVFKRGRNAKANHTPGSAGTVEYRRATGLETLFGWLRMSGEDERAKEIFDICFPENEEDDLC